ncbi:unnamed protein product [Arabis nemorensis]|uniref:Uncharacterized protein n=1 Tax=Arabis nemorensis TaxID=586526 RepID=A0A565CLT4_9BRAS|nr:unnamed protein product [Arabis nemorensis]
MSPSTKTEVATNGGDLTSSKIDGVRQLDVVPRVVTFLSREFFPELQLNNIAAGTSEDTKAVVESGAVPIFIKNFSAMLMRMSAN